MNNWKAVSIPSNMNYLPKDKRGYPVPYIVQWDKNNQPQFTINDTLKVLNATREKLCGICGKPLDRAKWFVGGPQSAFHPHGAYIDPPMHHDCAAYALQVCPWLATSRYLERTDEQRISKKFENLPDHVVGIVDRTGIPGKPEYFVLVGTTRPIKMTTNGYFKVDQKYFGIEVWRDGSRLEPNEEKKVKMRLEEAITL
jgi:hypothetical protein